MPTITSTAAGGAWSAGASWIGGIMPSATDDVVIATTGANKITFDLDHPATTTCKQVTINANACLEISAGNILSCQGYFFQNGIFTIITGTSIDPSGVRFVMTATEQYGMYSGSGATFNWGVGSGPSGTYTPGTEPIIITTNDPVNYKIYKLNFGGYTNLLGEIRNILIDGSGTMAIQSANLKSPYYGLKFYGNLTVNRGNNYCLSSCSLYSSDLVITAMNHTTGGRVSGGAFFGNINFVIKPGTFQDVFFESQFYDNVRITIENGVITTQQVFNSCYFYDNVYVEADMTSCANQYTFYPFCVIIGNVSMKLTNPTALVFYCLVLSSTGSLEITSLKYSTTLCYQYGIYYGFRSTIITNTNAALALTLRNYGSSIPGSENEIWQMSATKKLVINTAGSLTIASDYFHDPAIFSTNETTKTAQALFDFYPTNPTFYTLSGSASLWTTPGQVTFTAAGETCTYILSPWSVRSWASATITKSNTTDEFRWSGDAGVTWSGWLTLSTANLAALTAFGFYGQDYIQIRHTATAAGNVSKVVIGFVYLVDDTYVSSVTTTLEDRIVTNANTLGLPVALDGGADTIGGMLTKMADDNGGAAFDATTDSLAKLYDAVSAITGITPQGVADALKLAPTPGAPAAGSVNKHLDDIITAVGDTGVPLIQLSNPPMYFGEVYIFRASIVDKFGAAVAADSLPILTVYQNTSNAEYKKLNLSSVDGVTGLYLATLQPADFNARGSYYFKVTAVVSGNTIAAGQSIKIKDESKLLNIYNKVMNWRVK